MIAKRTSRRGEENGMGVQAQSAVHTTGARRRSKMMRTCRRRRRSTAQPGEGFVGDARWKYI
eukprot:4538784-Pyramimonas_sp.AAC.1